MTELTKQLFYSRFEAALNRMRNAYLNGKPGLADVIYHNWCGFLDAALSFQGITAEEYSECFDKLEDVWYRRG